MEGKSLIRAQMLLILKNNTMNCRHPERSEGPLFLFSTILEVLRVSVTEPV